MKKLLYRIFIIGLCSTWISCSNKSCLSFTSPDFPISTALKGKVLVDSFIMGACYDIACYNKTLLVIGYTGEDEEKLHLFSTETGKHIKSILPKGRGAGEAITVPHIDIDYRTGTAFFYDNMTCRLHHFQIDSIIRNSNTTNYLFSTPYPYMAQILKSPEGYIGIEGYRKADGNIPRLFLIEQDSVIDEYYTYPTVDLPVKNRMKASYLFAHYSLAHNKSKLACASTYGAILEIFNMASGHIGFDTIISFVAPVYTTDKNGFLKILPGETTWGFLDLYATDDYIYTIYCGGNDLQNRNKIAVFDWKGKEVCLYTTDYQLENICINDDTNKLYATAEDANGEKIIVEFELIV